MFDTDKKISIVAEPLEFSALEQKMIEVISNQTLRPAPENSHLYFLWGFPFINGLQKIIDKTKKLNNLFSNENKEIKVNISIIQAFSIMMCCLPNKEDSIYLARIITKIDKELPIEMNHAINKFIN